MMSDHVRDKVWQGLLDVSRGYRYYDAMFRRYSRCRTVLRVLLSISAIGGIASLLDFVPNPALWVQISGAVIGVVVVLDLVLNPSEKAAVLGVICSHMSKYERQARTLWESLDVEDWNDKEILSKSAEIAQHAETTSDMIPLPTHKGLNQKCTEETYKVEKDRYAA